MIKLMLFANLNKTMAEKKIQTNISYLGWNPVEIFIGSVDPDDGPPDLIKPDFQTGGIRNCSYAPISQLIGITSEDRTNGGQVVAVYERLRYRTQVLVRKDYLLHHSLNRSATELVYTEPSKTTGAADLNLLDLETGQSRSLINGRVAHDSIPSWFPDNGRLVYHTPDRSIETINIYTGLLHKVANGQDPAINSEGTKIAFRWQNSLLIWSEVDQQVQKVPLEKQFVPNVFANGLSWSPDGSCLSFGAIAGTTGKQTNFYIANIESGKCLKMKTSYLSGLLLLGNG